MQVIKHFDNKNLSWKTAIQANAFRTTVAMQVTKHFDNKNLSSTAALRNTFRTTVTAQVIKHFDNKNLSWTAAIRTNTFRTTVTIQVIKHFDNKNLTWTAAIQWNIFRTTVAGLVIKYITMKFSIEQLPLEQMLQRWSSNIWRQKSRALSFFPYLLWSPSSIKDWITTEPHSTNQNSFSVALCLYVSLTFCQRTKNLLSKIGKQLRKWELGEWIGLSLAKTPIKWRLW